MPGVSKAFFSWAAAWPGSTFSLSAAGAILMAPMLGYMLADPANRAQAIGPQMPIPEGLIISGMLVILFAVATTSARRTGAAAPLQQTA